MRPGTFATMNPNPAPHTPPVHAHHGPCRCTSGRKSYRASCHEIVNVVRNGYALLRKRLQIHCLRLDAQAALLLRYPRLRTYSQTERRNLRTTRHLVLIPYECEWRKGHHTLSFVSRLKEHNMHPQWPTSKSRDIIRRYSFVRDNATHLKSFGSSSFFLRGGIHESVRMCPALLHRLALLQ